ncbi:MAG: HipA family kinase, partial [Candidatus Kapaibacterium sp.]
MPTYTAVRYITPLREGGSLPAIVETEEGGMFATKFRGAGQGAKALIAELIVGGIATALGFDIPDVALIDLDEAFGRSERDPEIQELLRASHGTNVGLRYLPGSLNYDPVALPDIDPVTAADIVWLDALTTNIDRTPRNPNMMIWEG